MLNSKAITKIQSIILIAIIVVAGIATYVLLDWQDESSETIKIGYLANLDFSKDHYHGLILAAEQINAKGGILGRQVEVIAENVKFNDPPEVSNALTKLITQYEVDFIISSGKHIIQEFVAEHKIIYISTDNTDELSNNVLDNYDKYKYYFTVHWNSSAMFQGITDNLLDVRENTAFNKIGIISGDTTWHRQIVDGLDSLLPQHGFELVYQGLFPGGTIDFSSYFAAAEAAGVEAMVPIIKSDGGIAFVKEYYDRQSPTFLCTGVLIMASFMDSWEWTDGKCEDICVGTFPVTAGYPFTSKTIPTREAFFNRWNEYPFNGFAYDILRFILPDAIERAGTIETDAVIEALEETSVETSNVKDFVFTRSHCVMMGEDPNNPEEDFMIAIVFQWQDGELVPVYPGRIREETGTTYTFPDWSGSWDNIS